MTNLAPECRRENLLLSNDILLDKYLTENGYINTSVQKGGMPGVAGCLEHATMIWEAIQRTKSEELNLDVRWLDLANASGLVPCPRGHSDDAT